MIDAFARIRDDPSIGCALLTGAGDKAFCSGGDQRFKDRGGYVGATAWPGSTCSTSSARSGRCRSRSSRSSTATPSVAGRSSRSCATWPSRATTRSSARSGPQVGSFDAGFGIGLLARLVGDRKAKEIWFLCRRYDAAAGARDGARQSRRPAGRPRGGRRRLGDEILAMSPTAIRFLKSAFLVATDGLAGLQEFAGNATGLYYTTDEAHEGSTAFLEKRKPDFSRFPRRP